MNAFEEVVNKWAKTELRESLVTMNSILVGQEADPHSMDWTTLQVEFGMTTPIKCPEGHLDCLESYPSIPAIIISGTTHQGQRIVKNISLVGEHPSRLLQTIVDNTDMTVIF